MSNNITHIRVLYVLLESLITSKTRIRLLLKFFLNPGTKAYLRGLASEFGESTNAIRVELNRLTEAKLLKCVHSGRTVEYRANIKHSLFNDIQNVVTKFVGIDTLVEELTNKLGDIQSAYVIGDYAVGNDSGLMHLSAASKISTIGLFGPTNDKLYSPFGENCHIIRTQETYKDFQSIRIDKYKSYMSSIKVETVINLIENNNLI